MKLTIVFLLIVPIFSFKKCSNCKHFIKNTKSTIFNFGKCKMFPKTKDIYSTNDKKETVKTKTIEDMYYCSTAREYSSMCGVEGKWYQPK
jgi:hypothetical protein